MTLHLFEGFGVELEYMLVDAKTLAVRPIADRVLAAAAGGEIVSEVDLGPISWSNELVLHVLELKTNGPALGRDGHHGLDGLAGRFQEHVGRIDALLAEHGARLLPGAMHPLFDPETETRLWPHDFSPVYQAYDRIFGCHGHGWSNLQSAHLNLPFSGDEEFGRLHAAIRLVLPLIPALAASSPIVGGRPTGLLDTRLEVYRTNSRRIPSVTGRVVPEPVATRAAYEAEILQPMYDDIAPLDPEGVLADEFLNARGAIARFSRGSIEIRLVDVQECPRADLAVLAALVAVLELLVAERWSSRDAQLAYPTEALAALLAAATRHAEAAPVADPALLDLFGYPLRTAGEPVRLGDLWRHLVDQVSTADRLATEHRAPLARILEHGPLARRILAATGPTPSRERILAVYRRLADCLATGELFDGSIAEDGG